MSLRSAQITVELKTVKNGMVAPAGFESIKKAKENGSWTRSDEVEACYIGWFMPNVRKRAKNELRRSH